MNIDLSGKTALVTGSTRGIGRAVAQALANSGARVAIVGRDKDKASAVASEIGKGSMGFACEVSDSASMTQLIADVEKEFGGIDILVNNAGITRDDLIMRMSVEAWRDVLETNLFGAFYATKAVMRPMLKARTGRIINITSVSGQAGNAGQANYSAAKAGLIGLTKATAREVASRGITCNAIAPGFVLTELTQGLSESIQEMIRTQTPLGRFGTPEEVSAAVAFLASDEASYITGQFLAVDGGLVMM
jgi:3-oxoacyl-[acyl-carrier protein] reductase